MADEHKDQIRIVQETVAGKEITFAHIMGGPAPIIYQKLGLNPQVDYGSSAIGIMNMTPSESAVIASDIAVKSGNVYLGFADRFTGTLIITERFPMCRQQWKKSWTISVIPWDMWFARSPRDKEVHHGRKDNEGRTAGAAVS